MKVLLFISLFLISVFGLSLFEELDRKRGTHYVNKKVTPNKGGERLRAVANKIFGGTNQKLQQNVEQGEVCTHAEDNCGPSEFCVAGICKSEPCVAHADCTVAPFDFCLDSCLDLNEEIALDLPGDDVKEYVEEVVEEDALAQLAGVNSGVAKPISMQEESSSVSLPNCGTVNPMTTYEAPKHWWLVPADPPGQSPIAGVNIVNPSDCLAEAFIRSLYSYLAGPICFLSGSFVIEYEASVDPLNIGNDLYTELLKPGCMNNQRSARYTHNEFVLEDEFGTGLWSSVNEDRIRCEDFIPPTGDTTHIEVLFRGPPGGAKSQLFGRPVSDNGVRRDLINLCDTGCSASKRVILFSPFSVGTKRFLFFKLESHETTSSKGQILLHGLNWVGGKIKKSWVTEACVLPDLPARKEHGSPYECRDKDIPFYEARIGDASLTARWRGDLDYYNRCVRGGNELYIPKDLTNKILEAARTPIPGAAVLNPLNGS